jgi:biotin carboxylase
MMKPFRRKKIAVIGANLPLIHHYKRAKELGYEIHSFAWQKDAVCERFADHFYPVSFKDKELILNHCQRIGIDGITSFTLESALPTVNYIATQMNLQGNPPECVYFTSNKYLMRKRLNDLKVKIPEYSLIDKESKLFETNWPFPLVVKPIDSGGSRGVTLVHNFPDLIASYRRSLSYSNLGMVLVEQYINGREFSVEYISYMGIHYFVTITDKVTTGEPYFVELEHHQPALLTHDEQIKIMKITEETLDALKIYSSASHTELKMTTNGDIYVIEMGARMGGDMIAHPLVYLSTGYDFLKGVLQLCTGNFEVPRFKYKKYSGIYYLSIENEKVNFFMKNSELFPEIVFKEVYHKELKSIQESQDRAGCLVYQSKNKFLI